MSEKVKHRKLRHLRIIEKMIKITYLNMKTSKPRRKQRLKINHTTSFVKLNTGT